MSTTLRVLVHGALVIALLFSVSGAAGSLREIEWQRNPGESWRSSSVRTLEDVPGFTASARPPNLSRFGGFTDGPRAEVTGFFRVEKIDGTWWTIDPEGFPYIHIGLTSIRPTRHQTSRPHFERKFRDEKDWARQTAGLMRELGFNEIGRWSRIDHFNTIEERLPYTTSLMFMGDFGRKLGITTTSYGHLRYPENAIPVFHDEFESFAFEYAREKTAGLENDPWLVGHFTDNELPVPRDLLERTLRIDPGDPALGANVREARRWLRERRAGSSSIEDITDEENLDWLGVVMDRYYAVATAALREHAPNHINLGSRLHGAGPHIDQVVAAAGRHLDIVSINYYNVWGPADRHLARWAEHSAAPVMITEFYIKGADAAEEFGLRNELGAGWIVRSQSDRGLWYQNYTLRLLEAPHVVGWQYFKYGDEADDSNKGILNPRYERYRELTDAMIPIHRNAYDLRRFFATRTD